MKLVLTALFLAAITALNAQNMDKKTQPEDVVKHLFLATDQKQWDKVEDCFAKQVLLDYSSMGNPAATLTPKQITDAWKTILPGFTHTHHQLGNILKSTDAKYMTKNCIHLQKSYFQNLTEKIAKNRDRT